jgi:hypothetical protein
MDISLNNATSWSWEFPGGTPSASNQQNPTIAYNSLGVFDVKLVVSDGVNKIANDNNAIVMITHYQRLLNYIKPDYVHVMMGGKLIKSGGFELAEELEANGYDALEKELVLNGEAQ